MGTEPWANKDNAEPSPNHPANYVTWNDVSVFISRLNDKSREGLFRLPTEAEWEYACRASSSTLWPFGDNPTPLIVSFRRWKYSECPVCIGVPGRIKLHTSGKRLPYIDAAGTRYGCRASKME